MNLFRTGATLAGVLLLGASLTACGGDDAGSKAESSAKPAKASASVDPSRVSPKNLPDIPVVAKQGLEGALKDVKFSACPTKSGPVSMTATVKNPTDQTKGYAIVVSWINSTNDELGRAVASVRGVPGGATEKVTLKTRLKADVPVTCAYNVTRGTLKG